MGYFGCYLVGLILGMFIGIILMFAIIPDRSYKKGQIDAINGNIKYELIVQPNKSVEWHKIKEGK